MMSQRVRDIVMGYIAVVIVSATVAAIYLLPDVRKELVAALTGELGVITGFFFGARTTADRRAGEPPA